MSITNAWGFGLWLLGAMAVGCLAAGPAWYRLGGRQARKARPQDVRDVQEVWRRA